MSARRTAEYEEELWGPKVENEPQVQLLNAVCEKPRVDLRTADIIEELCPEQLKPESPHIKEEDKEVHLIKEEEELEQLHIKEEEQCIKEEEQEEIIKVPSTGVPLNREGTWEETGIPVENPRRYRENMLTPHKQGQI
ncbi:uncharacterized protein LOC133397331 isoform X2 [Phycodurus eques]|uniref:uncharacterized protein LOC133397331 isoform X2 n=1 Tax=Phycodurus eques TaxID=693459 RepID=UPI002ACEB9AE|nr:uncharacterized protein LOC133397331 isoform X2 [Phycodurus eques]